MAASRASRIFSATKAILGTLVIALEAAVLFVLADPAVGRILSIAAVVLVVAVVPIGVTLVLLRGLRKMDSGTTFWRNYPGVAAILALVVVVSLGWLAREATSHALLGARRRYPSAGGLLGGTAHLFGEWLAPEKEKPARTSPPPEKHPPKKAPPAKAVVKRAPDAGRARVVDAGSKIAKVHDAGPPPATHDAAPPPPPGPSLAGSIAVCDDVRAVFAVDLGQEPTDEIVVACIDGVHVLWPRPDGSVQERTRFTMRAPEGLEIRSGEPRVVDLDVDGEKDVVLCAYWTTPAGGTRGGDTWWARGQEDGQLARPARLVGGYCAGLDVGDVDGDGESELVVAHVGNPWQESRPNGELRWYERSRARWTPRGKVALARNPQALFIGDANGDAFGDVVVSHAWVADGWRVLPGSTTGPLAMDTALSAPPAPDRTKASARLDGDDRFDEIRAVAGGRVELWTTQAVTLRELTRALDYREYVP